MKNLAVLLLSLIFMNGCIAVKPVSEIRPSDLPEQKQLTVFPADPNILPYTRKPIISSQGNDFVVSDEFVNSSLKLKSFYDRTVIWKAKNDIE